MMGCGSSSTRANSSRQMPVAEAARSDSAIAVYREDGSLLASWSLAAAWPSALEVRSRPAPGAAGAIEQLRLISDDLQRDDPGGQIDSGSGRVVLSAAGGQQLGVFESLGGLGSSNELVEQQIIDPQGNPVIIRLPGQLELSDPVLRREVSADASAWAWRAQVSGGDVDTARQDVTVELLDEGGQVQAGWSLERVWPVAIELKSGPDGRLMEELVLVLEGLQRH